MITVTASCLRCDWTAGPGDWADVDKAARAYLTEAQIRHAVADFGTWRDLAAANFPPVEVPDDGEPYDPRDTDEKWRDVRNDLVRWDGANENVIPLCKTAVQKTPRRGEKYTPELHSGDSRIVSMSDRRKQA